MKKGLYIQHCEVYPGEARVFLLTGTKSDNLWYDRVWGENPNNPSLEWEKLNWTCLPDKQEEKTLIKIETKSDVPEWVPEINENFFKGK